MAIWIGFIALVCVLLALDLGVFNRKAHVIGTKEALWWTAFWIALSLLFSFVIHYLYGSGLVANPDGLSSREAVLKYLTGYLVEKSLSLDNIFVIAMIFTYFQVPNKYQHRVLFWGILGALIFRGAMIFLGVILITKFSWLTYIFGVFLLYSAYKMWSSNESVHPHKNPVIKYVSRLFPVTKEFHEEQFFVRRKHILATTPLFITLLVVETTDIMFAFDSIPAIFAITTDPFIVFTSNIFAILGLRSLYFVLASILDKFKYLQHALVFILAYVGVKMLLVHHVHIPEWLSLSVITVSLTGGVLVSLYMQPKASDTLDKDGATETPENEEAQASSEAER